MSRKFLFQAIWGVLFVTLLVSCGGEEKSESSTSEKNAQKGLNAVFEGNLEEAERYICASDLDNLGLQPALDLPFPAHLFIPETYEYEGKAHNLYAVEMNGELKILALVKPGRSASQFIDPENPANGLIDWEGSWRTLEPLWQFNPQASSEILEIDGMTMTVDCQEDGAKMRCEIIINSPEHLRADNPRWFDYTLTMLWDVEDKRLCNAKFVVPEETN